MKKILYTISLPFIVLGCDAQTVNTHADFDKEPTKLLVDRQQELPDSLSGKLDSLDLDYQFRGNCYAYSSKKYAKSSNGEAHSSNLALPTDSTFRADSLFLCLNYKEVVSTYNKQLGHKLYLANNTEKNVDFAGQDSRLSIIAEALNASGEWQKISYLPSSWCGNSYHTITLGPQEYWEFTVPVFKGTFKTKLRYVLEKDKDHPKIISNEIEVWLNINQFDKEKKEGHSAKNIMDPYDD